MSLTTEVAIVILLVLLNGFFAMSELAIISARRARLRQMVEEDKTGAQLVLDMGENPSSFLSIVQVGMTLNSVLAGAFSGATLAGAFGDYLNNVPWIAPHGAAVAMVATVAGVSYLNLVIGELVPKRIGLAYAERIAVRVARTMRVFAIVAAPIVWLLARSTNLTLKLLRLYNPPDQGVTEEEIKELIAEGTQSGALKPAEKEMLEGVMRLADRTVRSIMTPRVEMVWLDIDDPPREHKKVIRSSGYSRFPVARGDMEEILGIVHSKDLLNESLDGITLSLRSAMRPALVVPDTTTVLRLLEQFKRTGQHIAVAVDEYGSVEGLVSVTDILECITGGLPERGRASVYKPLRRDDGSWVLDGMMPVDEVESLTQLKDMRGEESDFQTLAGFMLDRLGHIPATGDKVMWQGAFLEVLSMEGRRVDKVAVMLPPENGTQEPGE